jgi:hypothetical protein
MPQGKRHETCALVDHVLLIQGSNYQGEYVIVSGPEDHKNAERDDGFLYFLTFYEAN